MPLPPGSLVIPFSNPADGGVVLDYGPAPSAPPSDVPPAPPSGAPGSNLAPDAGGAPAPFPAVGNPPGCAILPTFGSALTDGLFPLTAWTGTVGPSCNGNYIAIQPRGLPDPRSFPGGPAPGCLWSALGTPHTWLTLAAMQGDILGQYVLEFQNLFLVACPTGTPPLQPPAPIPPTPPAPPSPQPPAPPAAGCFQVEICNWPPSVMPPAPKPGSPPPAAPPGFPPPPSPPPPRPLPPIPAACEGFTLPLGLPLIGSQAWCDAQEGIIQTVKGWAIAIMDWLIGWADRIEKWGWDVAQSGLQDISELKGKLGVSDGGFLGGFADALQTVASTIAAVIDYLQTSFGYVIFSLAHATKAFVCLLRNAEAQPGFYDLPTGAAIAFLDWLWRTIKSVRLGTPDFGAFQFVGATVDDFIQAMLTALAMAVAPTEPPSRTDALEAYLNNRISEQQYSCWLKLQNCHPDVWKPVLDSRREQLTTDEHIDSVRRSGIPRFGKDPTEAGVTPLEIAQEDSWREQSITSMRDVGWLYSEDAGPRYALYDELPTIADHLHWLARNVDVPDYVRDYHLLDGFESPQVVAGMVGDPAYQPVGASLGRNFWQEYGQELRAQGMRKVDAARHYAAHWLHGSPGQMREFVWRLRPDRQRSPWDQEIVQFLAAQSYSPELISRATTFTTLDFQRLLSEQDYGYLDVGWFISTLYHVPALSYLRDMYRYGTIDEGELAGYHQDLGYSRLDSERFVDVDRKIKARIRASEASAWTPSALSRAFSLGLIDAGAYSDRMRVMGFSDAEIASAQDRSSKMVKERILLRSLTRVISRTLTQVSSAYSTGVLDQPSAKDALVKLGIPPATADGILSVEALKTRTKLAGQLTNTVHNAYKKGKINDAQAVDLLSAGGVSGQVIHASIQMWRLEQLQSERSETLAQIRRWAASGLISLAEARVRLTNLHYPDPDIQLILEEIQAKASEITAREVSLQDRQTLARQKALARAAAEAERAKQQALRASERVQPPATLRRWLRDGVIDQAYYRERMLSYGYDTDSIEKYIRDTCGANGENCPAP